MSHIYAVHTVYLFWYESIVFNKNSMQCLISVSELAIFSQISDFRDSVVNHFHHYTGFESTLCASCSLNVRGSPKHSLCDELQSW